MKTTDERDKTDNLLFVWAKPFSWNYEKDLTKAPQSEITILVVYVYSTEKIGWPNNEPKISVCVCALFLLRVLVFGRKAHDKRVYL